MRRYRDRGKRNGHSVKNVRADIRQCKFLWYIRYKHRKRGKNRTVETRQLVVSV